MSKLQWHCTVTCKCEASLDIYPAHIFAWLLVPLDPCHLIAVTAACDVLLKALCTKYGYEDSALRRSNGLNATSISMEGMGETWLQILITYSKAHRSWASYQIRKIAGGACAWNAGNVFPHRLFQRKPIVSDPGMHHGTCGTHVPWCMSGSLTLGGGENVPGIPSACAPTILRIWQKAHAQV